MLLSSELEIKTRLRAVSDILLHSRSSPTYLKYSKIFNSSYSSIFLTKLVLRKNRVIVLLTDRQLALKEYKPYKKFLYTVHTKKSFSRQLRRGRYIYWIDIDDQCFKYGLPDGEFYREVVISKYAFS